MLLTAERVERTGSSDNKLGGEWMESSPARKVWGGLCGSSSTGASGATRENHSLDRENTDGQKRSASLCV